ncbi:MAG: zinc-dependent metalloprotease [Bacteroidales bacterium]
MNFKLIFAASVFLALLPFAPETSADAIFHKHKAKADTSKTVHAAPRKKATPYQKFLKEVSDSAGSDFLTIYKTGKEKIYLGYPKNLLGRRLLAGGTVSSVSDPSYIDVGYKYAAPVYFQVDLKDTLVVLSVPSVSVSSQDTSFSKALERNYSPRIFRILPVKAFNKDSSTVIFEVTALVNSLLPKGKDFAVDKSSSDNKTSSIGEIKAFSDNASIKLFNNVNVTRTVFGFKVAVCDVSMSSTVSFLLLPQTLMRPRVQDSRVGVFSTSGIAGGTKLLLTNEDDGLRPYVLANRWRLQPSDSAAWRRGECVTVTKPIVWYVDDAFPQAWKAPIRNAVLTWNEAFEKIGFKDVMQVRDFPTKEEDPEFDPDNLKYNCLRFIPNATMNAMGPSWVDPVTGEILNASVLVYNDVVRLINNWRFVQTAQVDERVRGKKLPPEIIEESFVYVVSHEIGHTLGLMHNMGASASVPTDSLRSPSFTARFGTTPSIMDYARFNYVAQRGDKGVRLTPPDLGVYDRYVIEWLYKPVLEADDMWEEAKIAQKLLDDKAGDPFYRYAPQQISGSKSYGCYDPSARSEDLGDDPIKASNYGTSNLKYILPNVAVWITDDPDNTHRSQLYSQIANQYNRYLNNVLAQVGGIYLNDVKDGTPGVPVRPVSKEVQRKSMQWVIGQLRSCSWLNESSVCDKFDVRVPMSNKIVASVSDNLVTVVPSNVMLSSANAKVGEAYSAKDFYDDLFSEAFVNSLSGRKLTSEEKTMQRNLVLSISKPMIAATNKSSVSASLDRVPALEELSDEFPECGFGEASQPYQKAVDISAIDETDGYNRQFLVRVQAMAKSKRQSGPLDDRAHYEYLYGKTSEALTK